MAGIRENKKLKRKWLTWLRMIRYGANNFTRNAWLTTAATAVMTITLLTIFTTFVARTMLNDTVTKFRQNIDIPIFLEGSITQAQANTLKSKLLQQENVRGAKFISSSQAKEIYIKRDVSGQDVQQLQILAESGVVFPAQIDVNLEDPTKVDQLAEFIKKDKEFQTYISKDVDQNFTDGQKTIATLSSWASTTERVGLGATIVFIAISMLIIFNTIRMAIFNRRDEIEMMKLIGADKGFIRGPFVVEAVMYGFFAALITFAIEYFALSAFEPKIAAYGIVTASIKDFLVILAPLVLLVLIALGGMIGLISARLAVRRYLRL